MATAAHSPDRAEVVSAIRELVRLFDQRNMLTWASALAFQVVKAIVPFLLFGLALLGFLDLQSSWADLAKQIKPHMSAPAFQVLQTTAKEVLTTKQIFWVTGGLALAIWEMSGAIRAIMGGLAQIYEIQDSRPWKERMRTSILLAIAVSALILLAIAVAPSCSWCAGSSAAACWASPSG
jgi:membrane protein